MFFCFLQSRPVPRYLEENYPLYEQDPSEDRYRRICQKNHPLSISKIDIFHFPGDDRGDRTRTTTTFRKIPQERTETASRAAAAGGGGRRGGRTGSGLSSSSNGSRRGRGRSTTLPTPTRSPPSGKSTKRRGLGMSSERLSGTTSSTW